MGRPSLRQVRTTEILDAFERCVANFGLKGTSLEKIAEEAGMKRSILRHYIGNRDDLVVAFAKHAVAKYRAFLDRLAQQISPDNRIDQIVRFLLPKKSHATSENVQIVESLIMAAEHYDEVREIMQAYVDDLVAVISGLLKDEFPARTKGECWSVAYGVVCIWFNQESLGPLQLPPKYLKSARSSARSLIESLAQPT